MENQAAAQTIKGANALRISATSMLLHNYAQDDETLQKLCLVATYELEEPFDALKVRARYSIVHVLESEEAKDLLLTCHTSLYLPISNATSELSKKKDTMVLTILPVWAESLEDAVASVHLLLGKDYENINNFVEKELLPLSNIHGQCVGEISVNIKPVIIGNLGKNLKISKKSSKNSLISGEAKNLGSSYQPNRFNSIKSQHFMDSNNRLPTSCKSGYTAIPPQIHRCSIKGEIQRTSQIVRNSKNSLRLQLSNKKIWENFELQDIPYGINPASLLRSVNLPLIRKSDGNFLAALRNIESLGDMQYRDEETSFISLFNWQLEKSLMSHTRVDQADDLLKANLFKDELKNSCQTLDIAKTFYQLAAELAVGVIEEQVYKTFFRLREKVAEAIHPTYSTGRNCKIVNITPELNEPPSDKTQTGEVFQPKESFPAVKLRLHELLKRCPEQPHMDDHVSISCSHPLSVLKFFENDKVFSATTSFSPLISLVGILVLGDENTNIQQAHRRYKQELFAQRMCNDAVIRMKKKFGEIVTTTEADELNCGSFYSEISVNLFAAINYKGFTVVVFPLLATILQEVTATSSKVLRMKHELRMVDNALQPTGLGKSFKIFRIYQHMRAQSILYKISNDISSEGPYEKKSSISNPKLAEFQQKILPNLENLSGNSTLDSISFTNFWHSNGLRMRWMGLLLGYIQAPWLKHVLIVEMIGRSIKSILRECLQAYALNGEEAPKDFCGLNERDCWGIYRYLTDIGAYECQTKLLQRDTSREDLITLNLYNIVLSDSPEGNEFWRNCLAKRCSDHYSINSCSIKKGLISIPATYMAMQHHCGLFLYPCAISICERLKKSPEEPLCLRDVSTWKASHSSSISDLKGILPLSEYIASPKKIPLKVIPGEIIKESEAASIKRLLLVMILFTLAVFQNYSWDDINIKNKSKFPTASFGLKLKSWEQSIAIRRLAFNSLSLQEWEISKILGLQSISMLPESHIASVPARLLNCVASVMCGRIDKEGNEAYQGAEVAERISSAHWAEHHPIAVDIRVLQAWLNFISGNYLETIQQLQRAIKLAIVMSLNYDTMQDIGLYPLETLFKTIMGDRALKSYFVINEEISPIRPPNIKLAKIFRLLGHTLLLERFLATQKSYFNYESNGVQKFMAEEKACRYLEYAMQIYSFFEIGTIPETSECAYELALGILLLTQKTAFKFDREKYLRKAILLLKSAIEAKGAVGGVNRFETLKYEFLLGILLAYNLRYQESSLAFERVLFFMFYNDELPGSSRSFKEEPIPWFLDSLEFDDSLDCSNQIEPTHTIKQNWREEMADPLIHNAEWNTLKALLLPSVRSTKEYLLTIYINHCIPKALFSQIFSLFLQIDFLEKLEHKLENLFKIDINAVFGSIIKDSPIKWLLASSKRSEAHLVQFLEKYPRKMTKEELLDKKIDYYWIACQSSNYTPLTPAIPNVMGTKTETFFTYLVTKAREAVFHVQKELLRGGSEELSMLNAKRNSLQSAVKSDFEKLKTFVQREGSSLGRKPSFGLSKHIEELLRENEGRPKFTSESEHSSEIPNFGSKANLRRFQTQSSVTKSVLNNEEAEAILARMITKSEINLAPGILQMNSKKRSATSNFGDFEETNYDTQLFSRPRLPCNLCCNELDLLTNLLYYFLDIRFDPFLS